MSRAAGLLQLALAAAWAYLLTLLGAAARGPKDPAEVPDSDLPHLAVLVPAHDEEAAIEAAIASLGRQDYPAGRFQPIVIADNCSDRTAELARAAGARVIERDDPARPGKGRALAHAIDTLATEGPLPAVVVMDADCEASHGLLRGLGRALAGGAGAAQSDYRVSNPGESRAAALRCAAFALINTVRPLGKTRLGLSCGLLGTGMAFSPAALAAAPWSSFTLAEDKEQHLRLLGAGVPVVFVADAAVLSPMPTSLERGTGQQARWEAGTVALIRAWAPRLLRAGVAERDPVKAHGALEQLVPPQSLLLAGALGSGVAGLAGRSRARVRTAAVLIAAQALFVVGGLAVARAPAAVWRSLALAPALVARKLALYARIGTGAGPRTWERTKREDGPPQTTPAQVHNRSVGSV